MPRRVGRAGALLVLAACVQVNWDAPSDLPGCFGAAFDACGCLAIPGCAWCDDAPGSCMQVHGGGCAKVIESAPELCGPGSPDGGDATDGGGACPEGAYRCYPGTGYAEWCGPSANGPVWGAIGGDGCIGSNCELPAGTTDHFTCSADRTAKHVLAGTTCADPAASACIFDDRALCLDGVWKVATLCGGKQCTRDPGSSDDAPTFSCAGKRNGHPGDPCLPTDPVTNCSPDRHSGVRCTDGFWVETIDCDGQHLNCVAPVDGAEATCAP